MSDEHSEINRRTALAGVLGLGAAGIVISRLAPAVAGARLAAGSGPRAAGFPRAWFFRQTEATPWRLGYEDWEDLFDGLGGIMGKGLPEELTGKGQWDITRRYFTCFKRDNPGDLVLLHLNGKGRLPSFAGRYFPGHWLYYAPTRLTRKAGPGDRTLYVANANVFQRRRPDKTTGPDDIVLACTHDDGTPDFFRATHLHITGIPEGGGKVTVEGDIPYEFPVGAHVAAHVRVHPPNSKAGALWLYNFATTCPRDHHGRQAADVFAAELAEWFGDGGMLAAYDGLEFDVPFFLPDGAPAGQEFAPSEKNIDVDNDGHADAGLVDGRNVYGIGMTRFLADLRKRLPGKIIMGDGWLPEVHQRSFGSLSGIESEGFPRLGDRTNEEWSGGLNRHAFWNERGHAPRLHYMVTKNVPQNHRGHVTDDHYRQWRLIFAAAAFTGAAIAQMPFILEGESKPRQDVVFDELVAGKANRPGWLGGPTGPAVHLAAEATDLLDGAGTRWPAEFLRRFTGDGARFDRVTTADGSGMRVTFAPVAKPERSPDTYAPIRRFRLTDLDLAAGPLFVRFGISGEPLPGYPAEIGRRVRLRVPGENDEPTSIAAWSDAETSTPAFYFRTVAHGAAYLEFEVEGDRPVIVTDLLVTAAHDAMYREFEHGVVLANPSGRAFTFQLDRLFPGRVFRRIDGHDTQLGGPGGVNDGSRVGATVELSHRDGLALVQVR